VTGNPILGTTVLVLATLLIGMTGLVREVWRAKYNDRVIDWISAGLDRRISRFGRRYRENLLSNLRFIDLKGLVGRYFAPELGDVYVDVALRLRDPGKVPSSDLPAADPEDLPTAGQRRLIADFLGKPKPRVLAVIGAPGSGKTTLLQHTARELCVNRRRPHRRRRTPVLLYLREHASTIAADPKVALPVLVANVLARYGLTEPRDWLERQLLAGQCVVLLDGLDEVAQEEDRKAVSDWVTVQVTRYYDNDFVVTSRPLGYLSAPIKGAITLHTQPFTPEQVTRFVHAWYLTEERHSTGADDQDITRRAAAEADDLLTRLRGVPALRDLTVNPLLLTMIATLHRHHGALPGSRADLYAQICQVLLWRRQDAKKLKVEPRGDQKERLMRVLAFEMMRRKVRDLTTIEATAILRPTLRRIAKDLTAAEFLDDAASNGLLMERENGVRTFAHLTFQEYLAAAHIKDKNLQAILIDAVSDSWWRETTLLYVAGTDAGPIVEECLTADTLPALTLALDCAEEAGELAEDLQDRLEDLLDAGLAPGADPQRRKLLIGVTVARHLREVSETSNGTRLCGKAITARVYRFFLEDMASRGQRRPPDAPPAQLAHPNRVIAGMRGSDAVAFVNWINEITGGQPTYRLPRLTEIQDPAVINAFTGQLDATTHGIWLAPDDPGALPQLRTPDGAPHPWTISEATVRERLEADFRSAPLTLGLLPLLTVARVAVRILRDLDRDLAGALILSLIHDLDRARALALALARDPAPDPALPLALARTRARDLACDLANTLDLARARDLAPELARAVELNSARALDLARDLARATDLGSALDLDLYPDLARALDLDRDFDLDHSPNLIGDGDFALADKSETFLGRMLSQIVKDMTHNISTVKSGLSGSLMTILSRNFSSIAIATTDCSISPDLLANTTLMAIGRLREQLTGNDHPSAEWARRATNRFETLTESILAREQQVTTQDASVLRILALCLAAEAVTLDDPGLTDKFAQIAATVTWLEGRTNGTDQPTGTLVLALN
jgi:hypothetical protein